MIDGRRKKKLSANKTISIRLTPEETMLFKVIAKELTNGNVSELIRVEILKKLRNKK